MKIFDVKDEDFVNYKEPSMFVAMGRCKYKCCIDAGITLDNCQNHMLHMTKKIEVTGKSLYNRFIINSITKSVVLGGLDPMDTFDDVIEIITAFRNNDCKATFVIYTGYNKDEITDKIETLIPFGNIIIKFGRYVPGQKKHKDDVLGVELVSDNQYAEVIA